MKIRTLSILALMAGCSLMSVSASAQDYPTNYGNGETSNHASRYLRSFSVTPTGGTASTINVSNAKGHVLYQDKTDQIVEVEPGAELNVTMNYEGSWMHSYVYIDYGKDGQFSYDVDETNHTSIAGSDLCAFSFWSFNPQSDSYGFDSTGQIFTDGQCSNLVLPKFTAPSEGGDYRMRVKIDWNSIDPAGATTADKGGSMQNNGGVIVDITLRVKTPTPPVEQTGTVPYSIDFGQGVNGWNAIDHSTTPGATWEYDAQGFYEDGAYIPCVTMKRDFSSTYNDYFVSPAFELQPGTYYVQILAAKSSNGPACSLYYGDSTADVATYTKVSDMKLESKIQNATPEVYVVDITTAGTYRFAIHGTTELENPAVASLFSFAIDTENPNKPFEATIPYIIDFKESVNNWTVVDNNKDEVVWEQTPGKGIAVGISRADDDIISPFFNLQAGKQYKVIVEMEGEGVNEYSDISLMVGLDGYFDPFKESMTLPNGNKVTDESIVKPYRSGLYQFGLRLKMRGTQQVTSPLYVVRFSIQEVKDVTVEENVAVFESNFGTDPMKGWTAIDANKDNQTWGACFEPVGLSYDAVAASDDYIVSPAISFKKDQSYNVKFTLNQSVADKTNDVELLFGAFPTVAGLNVKLADVVVDGNEVTKTYRFISPETGDGFIAFHIGASVVGKITLTNLVVTPVGAAEPQNVTDLTADVEKVNKEVTLNWVNPTIDTANAPFIEELKVKIYVDNTYVVTLRNEKPGKARSYVHRLSDFSGVKVYTVKAMLGDIESTGTDVTVDIDKITGIGSLESAGGVSYSHATAQLNVEKGTMVSIYDVQGRQLVNVCAVSGIVSLSELPAGVYVVRTAAGSMKIMK